MQSNIALGHCWTLGLDIGLTVILFLYSQTTSLCGGLWQLCIILTPTFYLEVVPRIKFHSLHAHPWMNHYGQWEELHHLARSGLFSNILDVGGNKYLHKGKLRCYIHLYDTASQNLVRSWPYIDWQMNDLSVFLFFSILISIICWIIVYFLSDNIPTQRKTLLFFFFCFCKVPSSSEQELFLWIIPNKWGKHYMDLIRFFCHYN